MQPAAAAASGRYLLAGISFVNLAFFKVWSALLTYSRPDTYLMKAGATPADCAAAIVNTLALGVLLGLAAFWIEPRLRGKARAIAEWAFLAALLVPLNAIRGVIVVHYPSLRWMVLVDSLGMKKALLVAGAIGLAGAIPALLWRRQLVRGIAVLLTVLSVFAAFNIVHGVVQAAAYNPRSFADKPLAPLLPTGRTAPRIVWMIFDEWDYRLTFRDRVASVAMPEVDRFAGTALHASQAFPPSGQTPWSLPALTTGHLVREVEATGPDDLVLLLPPGEKPIHWRDVPTTFSEARTAGYNVGLVGFYHPYCRMFNNDLSACWWWPTALQYNSMGAGLFHILPNQVRSLFETDSRSPFAQALAVEEHGRIQRESVGHALELVTDPRFGFVFLHLAIPHAPYPYDRRTGQFTSRSPVTGYWDNLALLDRTVGRLRAAMEHAGLWDNSIVLLSADHWNRSSQFLDGKKEHRIPFLLKMPGQHEGLAFDHPFNTVLSHDLMLALMRGELTSAQSVAEWLDQRRTIADSPYSIDEPPM